jgi:catechol 2,3-dioxygenase-like lactoylglutathione lyase family enzyme
LPEKAVARALAASLLVSIASCAAPHGALAQLSAPNAAGIAMGHLHFVVHDVAATKAFWQKLGGTPVTLGATEGVKFPDVIVLLRQGEASGSSEGAVVNHVAFRVKSLAALEHSGFAVQHAAEYPGVASIYTPDGERIELFDDGLATNLGFTIDGGGTDATAERHNRKIDVPIIAHHVHLELPEGQVGAAKEWYATHLGGVRGKRWRYEAVDLPGINLNFSAAAQPQAPTKGRMLDHIGFEVTNLAAFCRRLADNGVRFDQPYQKSPSGFAFAFITDPWGTTIELTEGLRAL